MGGQAFSSGSLQCVANQPYQAIRAVLMFAPSRLITIPFENVMILIERFKKMVDQWMRDWPFITGCL